MGRVVRSETTATTVATGPDDDSELRDLLTVLDAAASERAIVSAEDHGTALALRLAAARPKRVAGVVSSGARSATS